MPRTRPGLPDDEHYTYMPHHRVCRIANAFKADTARQRHRTCNKFISRDRTFSPGIFSGFCPHGICWGFSIMRRYEGPARRLMCWGVGFRMPPAWSFTTTTAI